MKNKGQIADWRKRTKRRGFSLFEMLVVLAIVAWVSSVTFSSFPKMNSKLSLDLLTQDIALTIRQAQVYGTTVFGVGEIANGGGNANFQAYGVSFPTPEVVDSSDGKYKYTLFADVPYAGELGYIQRNSTMNRQNESYGGVEHLCMADSKSCLSTSVICGNPRAKNECLQRYVVSGRDKVEMLCLNYFADGADRDARIAKCADLYANTRYACSVGSGADVSAIKRPDDNSAVDIVFRRPKLQANISTRCGGSSYYPDNVGIVLSSDSGERRVVVVWKNGQIAIDR